MGMQPTQDGSWLLGLRSEEGVWPGCMSRNGWGGMPILEEGGEEEREAEDGDESEEGDKALGK